MPSHNDTPEHLRDLQLAFAGHLRDPEGVAAPGDVEDRRMAIYRRLFYNNTRALVSSAYPVVKSLYSDEDWNQLVREFFIEHRSHSPLFPEVPREFLRYLQEQREAREGDPPFLLELAHYQWVSVALNIDPADAAEIDVETNGDLLEDSPVLSPLAWPVSYAYPVHEICPDFQPEAPPEEPTHLLVYRRRDDKVRFMKINAISRLLLDQMKACDEAGEQPSGRDLLTAVAHNIGYADPEAMVKAGGGLLRDWLERDIVLGTRESS